MVDNTITLKQELIYTINGLKMYNIYHMAPMFKITEDYIMANFDNMPEQQQIDIINHYKADLKALANL